MSLHIVSLNRNSLLCLIVTLNRLPELSKHDLEFSGHALSSYAGDIA